MKRDTCQSRLLSVLMYQSFSDFFNLSETAKSVKLQVSSQISKNLSVSQTLSTWGEFQTSNFFFKNFFSVDFYRLFGIEYHEDSKANIEAKLTQETCSVSDINSICKRFSNCSTAIFFWQWLTNSYAPSIIYRFSYSLSQIAFMFPQCQCVEILRNHLEPIASGCHPATSQHRLVPIAVPNPSVPSVKYATLHTPAYNYHVSGRRVCHVTSRRQIKEDG